MPVVISGETLEKAGMRESEALIEIACRLFDVGKLSISPAARMAGLGRVEFEQALIDRKIFGYRPTMKDIKDDWETLQMLRQRS